MIIKASLGESIHFNKIRLSFLIKYDRQTALVLIRGYQTVCFQRPFKVFFRVEKLLGYTV